MLANTVISGVGAGVIGILALAQSSGYILVGVVTSTFLLLGGVYTARINRQVGQLDTTSKRTESLQVGQASLIDDLQVERTELRAEIAELRLEVDMLKNHSREVEMSLLECRQQEITLKTRIAELEAVL